MPTRAQIVLFGTFAAFIEGAKVSFARRGTERLLAYLALNGCAERPRIARALWPEASREHGLMNLRQALRAAGAAGCAGWIVAEGSSLRLVEGVEVAPSPRPDAVLLAGWDEAWIAPHRAQESENPDRATEALFDLMAWHRRRSPETALQIAVASESLLAAAPPARLVSDIAPVLHHIELLPKDAAEIVTILARAHYLIGQTDPSFALYGRIARELAPSEAAAHARLSQIVLLRESGASKEAARRAEAFAAAPPPGVFFDWASRYHQGYARYQAYGRSEDLESARRAVETGGGDATPITRLFPALNVAEALIDDGQLAAGRALLDEARGLGRRANDPLSRLTTRMLDLNLLAREGEAPAALAGLDILEEQALREKLAPFAALVLDRAATLALSLGRDREAHERLARSDQMRLGLGARRTPFERARLAPLGA